MTEQGFKLGMTWRITNDLNAAHAMLLMLLMWMPCAAYQLRAESHADPGLGFPGWWVGGGFVQMGLFLGF
jgi:hypothetical protein